MISPTSEPELGMGTAVPPLASSAPITQTSPAKSQGFSSATGGSDPGSKSFKNLLISFILREEGLAPKMASLLGDSYDKKVSPEVASNLMSRNSKMK